MKEIRAPHSMPMDLKEDIARQHMGIQTLETRHRDCLDFHEVSVHSISMALQAAYEEGLKASKTQ